MRCFLSILIFQISFFSLAQEVKPKCLEGNCKNKIGTYIYSDSSIYIGSFSDKLRNGQGKITYKSGATYEGEWLNDKRQGQGVFIDSLKNKYEGSWIEDKENGAGKFTDLKGNVYEGTWTNGELTGFITLRYRNGSLFEGQFNKGFNGQGKLTYKDGSIYSGNFVKNKRSGYGELIYHFGLTYKGNWVSNEIDGQGDFYDTKSQNKLASGSWKTEKTTEGDLIFYTSDDYMIRYYVTKDLYKGQSFNRLPNGNGTMIYNNGDQYEGEWINGEKEGFGKLVKGKIEENGYWEKGIYLGKEKPNEFPQITLRPETCSGNSEKLDNYMEDVTFNGNCLNGLKNGVWKAITSNGSGTIIKIATYKNGIRNGEYKEFHFDGSVSKKANYIDGLLTGRVINYAKDGRVSAIRVYTNGIIDSAYYYNIDNDNNTDKYYLSSVWSSDTSLGNWWLTFNSDEVNGKYVSYFPSGKIKQIGFSTGHNDEYGMEITYDEKGNIISDIEYESLEEHCFDDPDEIRNGWKIVGTEKRVYKDGFHIETYENDKLKWKGFDAHGARYSINGINGQLDYYQEKPAGEYESDYYINKTVYFKNNELDYEIEIIGSEKTNQKKTIFDNSGRISKIEYDSMVYQIDYTDNLFEKESFRQSLVRIIEINKMSDNFVMNFDDVHDYCLLLSFLKKGKFNITASGIVNGQNYTFEKYILGNSMIDSISKNGKLIALNTTYLNGNSVDKSFYESGKIKSSIQHKQKFYYYDGYTHFYKRKALNGEITFFNEKGDKILFGEIYEEISLNSINYTGNLTYYDTNNVKTEIKLNGELPTNEVVNKILKEVIEGY